MLINKYLIKIRGTINILEDISVYLFEGIIVQYIILNLLKEYTITKWMIFKDIKLSTYFELEIQFYSKELFKKVQKSKK